MSPENRNFKRVPWVTLALLDYLARNVDPDELRPPEGVDKGEHLRRIAFAEVGVDPDKLSDVNRRLFAGVNADEPPDTFGITQSDLRALLTGSLLNSLNYQAIAEVLYDDKYDNL